jgi:RNA polymerase sigma factor (sigma-70 family)
VLGALSDERLVEQVRRGNEAAFETVYDRHHRGILAFCRHMLSSPDEAEDAVQQTFISAYDAMLADARELKLKPWLYAIARNRCLSTLRARREEPAELDDVPTAGLSEEVQQRSELRELLRDLHALPVDQRAALVLSEVGGLSHAEVGTVVGCEVAKVKSLVFQARSSLIETRKAREIPCHEIREQLATATGGMLRRGPLRRHLRACAGCTEYRDEVVRQRKALAAILPVVPTVGLKGTLLSSIGFGGGGGGAAIGGGMGGGGIASLASSSVAAKAVTVMAVAGVAVGGGLVLDRNHAPKPAEAAEAATGGGQAWPAPAAGTGPGAQKLAPASISTAAASHLSAAAAPVVRKIASKTTGTQPGTRHGAQHPNASGGVKQRGLKHRGGPGKGGPEHGGRHSGSTHSGATAPAPAPAAAAPSTTGSAPSSTSDDGGRSHGHHGGHRGWTQGRGHAHHEQDSGGTHVPGGRTHHPQPAPEPAPQPQPDASGDEDHGDRHGHHSYSGGDDGGHHDGYRSGDDR